MGIRSSVLAVILLSTLLGGCGAGSDEVQAKKEDLAKRVTKLEDDLHVAKRQLIAQKQALQILNERMKTMEANVDKVVYGSGARR